MKPLTHAQRSRFDDYLRCSMAGCYLADEPLSAHTWYRIGGPADYLIYPPDAEALVAILRLARDLAIPTVFLGHGANVLAHDDGFRGAVLCLARHFTRLSRQGETVTAGAGAMLADLVLFCEQCGLGGVEGLAGIPGTVGGALIMNAGADHGEIGRTVAGVEALDSELRPVHCPGARIGFGYRSAPLLQDKILLDCTLTLTPGKTEALREFRLRQLEKRANAQPLDFASCGSVFKRPAEGYVGRMVETAGLKGLRCGDAMISPKHGGFIVNIGRARARDVLELMERIEKEIYERYRVHLEREVRLVGFD